MKLSGEADVAVPSSGKWHGSIQVGDWWGTGPNSKADVYLAARVRWVEPGTFILAGVPLSARANDDQRSFDFNKQLNPLLGHVDAQNDTIAVPGFAQRRSSALWTCARCSAPRVALPRRLQSESARCLTGAFASRRLSVRGATGPWYPMNGSSTTGQEGSATSSAAARRWISRPLSLCTYEPKLSDPIIPPPAQSRSAWRISKER